MVFVLRSSPNHASRKYRRLTERNIKITPTYDNSLARTPMTEVPMTNTFKGGKKEDFDVATGVIGVA